MFQYKNRGEFYRPDLAKTFIQDRKFAFMYSINIKEVLEMHLCFHHTGIPLEVSSLIFANIVNIPGYGTKESIMMQCAKSPLFWGGVTLGMLTACTIASTRTSSQTNTTQINLQPPSTLAAPASIAITNNVNNTNSWVSNYSNGTLCSMVFNNSI